MPDLLSTAERLRRSTESDQDSEINRIVAAFRNRVNTLEGDIDALSRDLEDEDLNPYKIKDLASYKRLEHDTEREMTRFQEFLIVEIGLIAAAALAAGSSGAADLLKAAGVQNPNTVSPDALENLIDFLDPDGPLFAKLKNYGEQEALRIAGQIISGVRLGQNPRVIARWIVENGFGVALTDALRIVRTVQLYSYREANRATYLANSDVVKGWVWMSALIPGRTCMSCVAMHGTIHNLSERLNDHHSGLCAMLPYLGGDSPIRVLGEEWFNSQSLAVQRKMMGPGKYEAWKAGKFAFSALTTDHEDDVYGVMRVEASLKSLIGE